MFGRNRSGPLSAVATAMYFLFALSLIRCDRAEPELEAPNGLEGQNPAGIGGEVGQGSEAPPIPAEVVSAAAEKKSLSDSLIVSVSIWISEFDEDLIQLKEKIEVTNALDQPVSFLFTGLRSKTLLHTSSGDESLGRGELDFGRPLRLEVGETSKLWESDLTTLFRLDYSNRYYDSITMEGSAQFESEEGTISEIPFRLRLKCAFDVDGAPMLTQSIADAIRSSRASSRTTNSLDPPERQTRAQAQVKRIMADASELWEAGSKEPAIVKANQALELARSELASDGELIREIEVMLEAALDPPPPVQAGFERYVNPAFGFSIDHPIDWEPALLEGIEGTAEEFGGVIEIVVTFSVGYFVVTVLSNQWMGPDDVKRWTDFSLVKAGAPEGSETELIRIEVNGREGYRVSGLVGWNVIFLAGGNAYHLHSMFRAQYPETIDWMLGSFEIAN